MTDDPMITVAIVIGVVWGVQRAFRDWRYDRHLSQIRSEIAAVQAAETEEEVTEDDRT
jgi:hypothetical protein